MNVIYSLLSEPPWHCQYWEKCRLLIASTGTITFSIRSWISFTHCHQYHLRFVNKFAYAIHSLPPGSPFHYQHSGECCSIATWATLAFPIQSQMLSTLLSQQHSRHYNYSTPRCNCLWWGDCYSCHRHCQHCLNDIKAKRLNDATTLSQFSPPRPLV